MPTDTTFSGVSAEEAALRQEVLEAAIELWNRDRKLLTPHAAMTQVMYDKLATFAWPPSVIYDLHVQLLFKLNEESDLIGEMSRRRDG